MGKTFGEDFAKDVQINKFKLDDECEIQPSLYHFYATEHATARAKRDAEENRLKLVLAQRELHYRRNPPEDIKITEAVITALVTDDREVREAREALQKAQAEVDLLYAAVASLDNRKASLDNLVSMWAKDYYNGRREGPTDDIRGHLNREKE